MTAFRTALVVAWLVIGGVTVNAISTLGVAGGKLFITDFAHPWRAQFNGDFSVYLLLMMGWIAYRERKPLRAVVLALPVVLGSLYTLPYIFVATFRANGRFDVLLLGERRGISNIGCHEHLNDSASRRRDQ
ncbi:MAG: hypothetical protein QOH84_1208 [Kribbellaceae bacterium]|nr:hypothetical protein [Kribbellaceae bacterium]